MKQFRLLWAVAIATLLLVVFLTTCPVVVVKAQEPYPPVRIAEPGGDCANGPFIDPDEDGHYRFSLERTAEGCCTSSYWHYCEWPRGEVPSYTAHVEITMHSDATSFAAVGEVGVPYQASPLYCRVGQNQGVYDKVCTESYTRTTGIDNDDSHPSGFQLNGPSYGEIDIWLDGWTYEIITQTNYCPDGTEVISNPVYLEAGEYWASDAISTTWNYLQARYTISNANEPAGRTLAGLATLNGKDWLWGPESNGTIVSVTIPSSIGYDEEPNGPVVELGVRNTYDPFYLVSACIVPYSQTMVPSGCNLVNHSFTEDLPGWSTLVYDYLADEEDGAISLDSITGLASQVVTLTGSFKMEVRARSGGTSSSFRFGGYELGYPFESEEFTETATSEYQIFSGYLYLNGDSNISIVSNDDDLIVDWVCLSGHDTGGLPWAFPIPDCTFPSYNDHPDFSITEIGNWIAWLAEKFGELIEWLVCEFYVIMFTIANAIIDAIRAIGGFVGSPDWPTLPDEITFDSILEWFRQCFVAFFNWLGLNFSRFRNAIPTVVGWLWDAVVGVIGWIIDSLIGPIFGWLLDQLLAALGIGEDAREAFMILWRDAGIFLQAAWIEAGYEFDSLMLLLQETASVFGVLIVGFRGVATGDSELDFGESLGGLAAYLWRGVSFINDVVSFTPLSALNIVALGIITIGLAQWTVKKFVGMLEHFS